MNGYNLSRTWFDFCFENPEKIKPNHTALYFFCIEHCNRLGWKKKFGLPTTMAKEAIGIKSYTTYINTLNDLQQWGFVEMVERSKNQYSANIIALSNFSKALDKALDKALIKHGSKQSESIDSIDKQETKNKEQWFIGWFNKSMNAIKGKEGKYKLSDKVKRHLHARIKEGYTSESFKQAFKAIASDDYHKENNYKYLTPEFITRVDKLEKWCNVEIEKLEEDKGKGEGGVSMEELYNANN